MISLFMLQTSFLDVDFTLRIFPGMEEHPHREILIFQVTLEITLDTGKKGLADILSLAFW